MPAASMAFAWFMSLFGIGNSMMSQYNARQMQQQQLAQQQALQEQQLERRYHLRCDLPLRIVVLRHVDGTSEAVCR